MAICVGNSLVPGEFPAQWPVTWSFDVFFDMRLNKRFSKQSWGWWFETLSRPLWRHCNEYQFIVGCKMLAIWLRTQCVKKTKAVFKTEASSQFVASVLRGCITSWMHWLLQQLRFEGIVRLRALMSVGLVWILQIKMTNWLTLYMLNLFGEKIFAFFNTERSQGFLCSFWGRQEHCHFT